MRVGGSVPLGRRVCASPCKCAKYVGVCVNMRHIILTCERKCVCVPLRLLRGDIFVVYSEADRIMHSDVHSKNTQSPYHARTIYKQLVHLISMNATSPCSVPWLA